MIVSPPYERCVGGCRNAPCTVQRHINGTPLQVCATAGPQDRCPPVHAVHSPLRSARNRQRAGRLKVCPSNRAVATKTSESAACPAMNLRTLQNLPSYGCEARKGGRRRGQQGVRRQAENRKGRQPDNAAWQMTE